MGTPYKVCSLNAEFRPNFSSWPYTWGEQSSLLSGLVRGEGPIHFQYAVQRLAEAWGFKRTGSRIVDAVKEAVRICQSSGLVCVKGNFLWPPGFTKAPVRVPVPGVPLSWRKIEHIPPEEIERAMKLIVRHAMSIGVESLIVETARVFGSDRTGSHIRDNLLAAYDRLLKGGKLAYANGIVRAKEENESRPYP